MQQPLIVENTIIINAPAAKVWDELVNPQQTKKYMFGCEAVSGWQPGDLLEWRMDYEGRDYVAVKGHVIRIEPHKSLVYTVFDPNAAMEDVPDNYLTVTYALEEGNGETTLTVTQSGFEKAAEGEKRYKEVYNNGKGWNRILVQIKTLAEA